MSENLSAKIEAILFLTGEPVKIGFLAKNLNENNENILAAILDLEKRLENRGICLIRKDDKVMLATSPFASDITKKIIKEKYEEELTKPMLETLAIILYNGGMKKTDIDYVRGVNSVFTLRNLLIRGLVEKKEIDNKSGFAYNPSLELIRFLGLKNLEELPQKNDFKQKIEKFLSERLESVN